MLIGTIIALVFQKKMLTSGQTQVMLKFNCVVNYLRDSFLSELYNTKGLNASGEDVYIN